MVIMILKIAKLPRSYLLLVILRFLIVFIPQTGYVHPDEFFQTLEVLIGKFLEVEANIPWEFNITQPIRSMAIPYFTIGMSVKSVRDFNHLTKEYFSYSIIKPYYLLVMPRLLMCMLSLIVDYCLYKICMINNEVCLSRLKILASSYVILIYGTRTSTNTFELILFSLLLYFISESLIFSNIIIRKKEYLNYRVEKSKSSVDRAKFHKLRLYLKSDLLRNCIEISIITVIGFFNRPTFIAFAVIPIFLWLYRGIGSKSVTNIVFHTRILVLLLCCAPTFVIFVVVDSFYYGYLTWGEIGMLDVSINNFLCTPFNFMKYNVRSENLATHGLHPRYLHWLINIPLLFNLLAAVFYFKMKQYVQWIYSKKFHLLPTLRSLKGLMLLTIITSVSVLCIFPHQEPRFLIPLILPLTYLYGPAVLNEASRSVLKASVAEKKADLNVKSSSKLFKVWLVINVICVIFFGFLHQGGVFRSVEYLSEKVNLEKTKEFHIFTSHIYMLPQSMLLQPAEDKLCSPEITKCKFNKRIHIYEDGSRNLELTMKKIQLTLFSLKKRKSKGNYVYLLLPSSLENQLWNVKGNNLQVDIEKTFYGHISTEAFPQITYPVDGIFHKLNTKELYETLSSILRTFNLYLIKCSLIENDST